MVGVAFWLLAIGGFCLWYVSIGQLGERFGSGDNQQHLGFTLAGTCLGAISIYPMSSMITDLNGEQIRFRRTIQKAGTLYLVFGLFGFLGRFRLARPYILVRHGPAALRRYDSKPAGSENGDETWFELRHGQRGEDLRMKRLDAYGQSQRAEPPDRNGQEP